MSDGDIIASVIRVVRRVDTDFRQTGGSSRHWVCACLLPELEREGLTIVTEARIAELEAERDALKESLRICYEEGWPSTENEHPWLRNDPEHLEPPEYERAMTPDEFVEWVASGQSRKGGGG